MTRTFTCFLLFVPSIAFGQDRASVRPEIAFLSAADGANQIAGDADDEFFAKLYPREAATMTGVASGDKTLPETRTIARNFFRAAVLEFSDEERAAVRFHLDRVMERFGDRYPLLVRRPWKFLKTRKELCGGFSFTRGDSIVLSEATLARFVKAAHAEPPETTTGESLLLHEQMHVLQRACPELFKPLYEHVFHFNSAPVSVHPWIEERHVTNPDGLSDDWVAVTRDEHDDEATYWIGTLLLSDKPVHTMGRDFSIVAVPVTKDLSGYQMAVGEDGEPRFKSLEELSEFTSRLPIGGGYDHPNEVAAYLFTAITHGPQAPKLSERAAEVMQQAKDWFGEHLKPNGQLHAESACQPKRYVIIHADDAGMSHSVNRATIDALENGLVSSASIMVPCPWFPEFARYAQQHPDGDYGIHLTLNAEWSLYRWGPVAERHMVPSLVDENGYLWDNVQQVIENVKVEEAELELRAQINRAKKFGVPLSHLDTHMGAVVSRPDLAKMYVKLGLEFDLPVLFIRPTAENDVESQLPGVSKLAPLLDARGLPLLDALYQFYDRKPYEERKQIYLKTLRELPSGVSQIIIHCGYDDSELRGITSSVPIRDGDRRIFMEEELKSEIQSLGVEVIGWRQFRALNREFRSPTR